MSAAKILSGEIGSIMLFRPGDGFMVVLPLNLDAGAECGVARFLVRRVGDRVEAIPCDVMGLPLAPEAKPEDGAEEVPHGR